MVMKFVLKICPSCTTAQEKQGKEITLYLLYVQDNLLSTFFLLNHVILTILI